MFVYGYYTTKGRIKKVNQDALLIMELETARGPALFAAICDGMGGLADGEIASALVIRELEAYVRETLPDTRMTINAFRDGMEEVVARSAKAVSDYAGAGRECGTTLLATLFTEGKWYTVNVGDTRFYTLSPKIVQVTKDQTYVQREMDAGRMTKEEAATHRMRSILLQCIGASDVIVPDWYDGRYHDGDAFMLCSDGFRHVYNNRRLGQVFTPQALAGEKAIAELIEHVAAESMESGERDNITAIAIRVTGDR